MYLTGGESKMDLDDLLSEIDIVEDRNSNELDSSYSFFKKYFMQPENKPTFNGKEIYFEYANDNAFKHICSIDDILNGKNGREKYNMYPCTNHIAHSLCNINCNVTSQNNPVNFFQNHRAKCIYRAKHMPFIYYILKSLESHNTLNIKVWKNPDNRKDNRKNNRWNILYKNSNFHYHIILQEYYKNGALQSYRFITGYPLVLISEIKRLESNYNKAKASNK